MPLSELYYDNCGLTSLFNSYYHMFLNTDSSGNYYEDILGITIKKPYKVNKVIYVYERRSSRPTGVTNGYQIINTSTNKLEWYDGSTWHSYDLKSIEDNGTAYLIGNTLYQWKVNGRTGTLLSFTPTYYNMLCMLVTTELGTNMKKDDWYFASNIGYLCWYDGYRWNQIMYAPTLSDYWLYAQNGCVYNVYHSGSNHYFNDYYSQVKLTVIRNKDSYAVCTFGPANLVSGSSTTYFDFSAGELRCYAGTYYDSCSEFTIKAEYYYKTNIQTTNKCYLLDGTSNTSESITTELIGGRKGTFKESLTQDSTNYTYNLTDDILTVTFKADTSSSSPAGILRPNPKSTETSLYPSFNYYNEYESKYGVAWRIEKVNGATTWNKWLRGSVNNGEITIISGTSEPNKSTISIKLNEPGTYYIRAYYVYINDSNAIKSMIAYLIYRNYSKSKPTIEIVSVTPAEYMQGSSVGTDGIPPYTVVYKDSTASQDAWQIPQDSILFDFGDSSSSDNTVYIKNHSIYLITVPNQTHIYNGYGGYTAKLTITDKRGNVTTGSVPFEPNKTARIIKPPVISYSPASMLQPVLATGQAFVAGDPLPEVTWSYSTSGYSGSKTGEYTELSLLKAGTYTINCTPAGLTTTTWTPTVISRDNVPDDSQGLDDFALVVLDENNYPVDYCKEHTTIQYTEYYQNTDTFSFDIPQIYKYARYLQEGEFLLIGYRGKARLMEITCRSLSDGVISISGESVFPQRIALRATKSSTSEGYDVQTYYGEDLIRYFIWTALEDSYGTQPRNANITVFDSSLNRGGTITYSARFDNLLDIIISICQSCNLGFTTSMRKLSGSVPAFDYIGLTVTQGNDRTAGETMVVFAPDILKNCRVTSDSSSTGHNVAIAADWQEGSSRQYKYYGSTLLSGFKRKELFVDGYTASSESELQRIAELALLDEKQLSIKIQVLPSCQWKFGTDYNVGDIVTVITADRGEKQLQIYSAETVRRATGDELYLSLGYESITAPSLIKRTQNENIYKRR